MSTGVPSPQRPTVKEDEPRANTLRSEIWGSWAQVIGTAIAALAFLVAIYVAYQSQEAIKSNAQIAERQSQDSQLSTAISAIQNGDTEAGLVLLGENTIDRLTRQPETGEPPSEVYNNYNAALQIIAGYLTRSKGFIQSCNISKTVCYGHGWGPPMPAIDITDAANQINLLLSNTAESQVAGLKAGRPDGINLSGDELAAQQWSSVNFGWIPTNLSGADLRGTDLAHSRWNQSSDLSYSYLQCADLQGADFQGADLTYADLRGANVQGADFRGAQLEGVRVAPVYGVANWPQSLQGITSLPVEEWHQAACLQNSKFWDNQPSAGTGTGTGTGR